MGNVHLEGLTLFMSRTDAKNGLDFHFNQVVTQSCFPDEWKLARITAIFKNGQHNLPENYRPISVLPVISKIMERILYDQLYNYLTKFGILSA